MLDRNKTMQKYLKSHGINAIPKYIDSGSLRGSWRLVGRNGDGWHGYQRWTYKLISKLTIAGFCGLDGKPLDIYSGNGGVFSVFARMKLFSFTIAKEK